MHILGKACIALFASIRSPMRICIVVSPIVVLSQEGCFQCCFPWLLSFIQDIFIDMDLIWEKGKLKMS